MASTFQLINFTLSNTSNSIPITFFGLQDALNINYQTPDKSFKYPSLFPDACEQDDKTRNCTTSCLNKVQMFASLDTLHNCVLWPSIYVEDETNGLLPSATGLATSLGLEKGSEESRLPSDISTTIQSCLLDLCDNNDDCKRNADLHFPSGGFREHFSAIFTGELTHGSNRSLVYFNPCQYSDTYATADVAGIGVFISYATQMGLALVAFALAMPWKNVAHSVRNVAVALWHRLRPGKETHSKAMGLPVTKPAQQEPDKGDADHTLKFDPASAIIPAVVEFQKAQCYFMLATNIASIIVQIKGGLDPESFQQLYNTYIFIKVIAIGGYLPITFGLLTLRMLNKVGWYLLALSIASVGVAIPNLYIKRSFSPTSADIGDLQTQSVQNGPPSCGGNNPIAWCYKPIGVNSYGFRATNTVDGADDILAACLVTLALLMIEHFWNSRDRTNRNIRNTVFRSSLSGLKSDRFRRLRPVTRWLWRYIVPAFFTLLVLIHLYCFAVFAEDLDWFRFNEIYDPSWGFGQIVAVLIWAPPLCEYFWETFRGIEDGSVHRLPHGFEVRKKENTENSESEVGESSEDLGKEA